MGPPLYIENSGPARSATVTRVGPDGNVPLFVPGTSSPGLTVDFGDDFGGLFPARAAAMMTASKLTPGARYRLTVTPDIGAAGSTTFTTEGSPAVSAERPRVLAVRRKSSRGVKITTSVTLHNVALAGPPWQVAIIEYIRLPKRAQEVVLQNHQDAPAETDQPFINVAPSTQDVTISLEGKVNLPTSLRSVTMRIALVAPTWNPTWLIPVVAMKNLPTGNWGLPKNLLKVPIRLAP